MLQILQGGTVIRFWKFGRAVLLLGVVLLFSGPPPGNDKIRGTLEMGKILILRKKSNKTFDPQKCFLEIKSTEFLRKSGSPLLGFGN